VASTGLKKACLEPHQGCLRERSPQSRQFFSCHHAIICTLIAQDLILLRDPQPAMPIKYFPASDVKLLTDQLIQALGFVHIPKDRVICVRSVGSKSRGVIARVHSFPRVWQRGLSMKSHYAIEVISERFDNLSATEREKVIIHELLHIPRSFGGGFRHHKGWVTKRRVDQLHAALAACRLTASSNG